MTNLLDEFRSTNITWDKATSRIYSPVTANESDENGRKLAVQIVNSGQVEDLTGTTLHLYWETKDKLHDGLDVFKAVDLKNGEFELSYTTGMLSNKGILNANLVLIDTVGRVVSERFKITVTEGIDNDAIQSENSFSSLTQALIEVGPRLNELTAQLQKNTTVLEGIDKTFGNITFATPADLQSAYPTGDTKRYIVASDGKWYWYNGTAWIAGQVAQAIGIPNESVGNKKLKINELEVGDKMIEIVISGVTFTNQAPNVTTGALAGNYNDRITSQLISATRFDFNATMENGRLSVYKYNIDGTYIGQIHSGIRVGVTLESGFLYRILYAFVSPGTLDIPTISQDLIFYEKVNPIKLQKNIIKIENLTNEVLSRIDNGEKNKKSNKFMHLSCDDTLDIFIDIKNNGYASIFDNPVLGFLKNANETYGLVFSFYCFYETVDQTFNLTMFPDTYKEEFKANADWLKFGVHFLSGNGGNFGSSPGTTPIYKNIMSELFRICGGADSLDVVPRFHAYLGSIDFVKSCRDSNFGLKGLLTSEDIRTNYYLDAYQTEYMQTHDRLYDYQNNIMLFSTDMRLENITDVSSTLTNRLDTVDFSARMNDLIIFTHEQFMSQPTMQEKIIDCCEFAVTNGYDFDFPQNRLSL